MAADDALLAPAPPPRPSVYGRNYSYFSHRIFVVFMPEEMHKYLDERLELVASVAGESATDSDRLETQLVRWVLLHRSQLNALALNRLLESWRGDNDLLAIPPGLRSDPQYLMDITLQFALELELATAQHSPMLRNRPRLLMAMLDAAYYLSRQRLEVDRHLGTAGDRTIDLSDTGLDAFRRYLVQRMNLEEDRRDSPAADLDGPQRLEPLSIEEVQWLQSVAAGMAKTLTTASSKADLERRWRRDVAPRWQKLGLTEPDQALFDALLVGQSAPLDELPITVDSGLSAVAGPSRSVGSLRFRWRESAFPRPAWSSSLEEIVAGSHSALRCIRAVEHTVRLAMLVTGAGSAADDPMSRPLRDLADRYRLLPTTPAWSSVEKAIENLQRAARGLGTIDAVYRDSLVLAEYSAMLCRAETAEVLAEALPAAALLAGLREDRRRSPQKPPTPSATSAARDRPAPHDWEAALTALSDGLRCNEVDLSDMVNRLREFRLQLSSIRPVLFAPGPLKPARPPVPGSRRLSLRFWRWSIRLDDRVRDAYHDGLGGLTQMAVSAVVSLAWTEVARRAGVLAGQALSAPPAHASEIVCQVLRLGPAALLPMRLERATCRQWTRVAVLSLRDAVPDPAAALDAVPTQLAAHALERLGMRSLHSGAQAALLFSLGAAGHALRSHVESHGLWAGLQASGRVAIVIGPPYGSISDAWPLPPRDGLVLACVDAEIEALEVLVDALRARELPEPLRVAIEPLPKPSAARGERWIRGKVDSFYRLIWLTRAKQTIDQHPQLVDPKSADELWEVGDQPPTAPS